MFWPQILFLRHYGWEDSFQTHLAVSTIAGLVTSTAVAPADMIKSELQFARLAASSHSLHQGSPHTVCSQACSGLAAPLWPAIMFCPLLAPTTCEPAGAPAAAMFAPGNGYSGPLECMADIWRRLGLRGFFRGWGAQWARQGPMTSIIFVVNEQASGLSASIAQPPAASLLTISFCLSVCRYEYS